MPDIPESVVKAALQGWREQGREHDVPVEGYSMWPLLRPNDVVRVALGVTEPQVGDIIVFQSENGLVVHRVRVRPSPTTWITRGDNMTVDDSPVTAEMLVGRVTGRLRKDHYLALEQGFGRLFNYACYGAASLKVSVRALLRGSKS